MGDGHCDEPFRPKVLLIHFSALSHINYADLLESLHLIINAFVLQPPSFDLIQLSPRREV